MTLLIPEFKDNLQRNLNKICIFGNITNIRVLRDQTKSIIYMCTVDGLKTSLVVKILKQIHHINKVKDQVKLEYDALTNLYNINDGDDCHMCPKVYPIMTDSGAIVMDYVEGPTLTEYIIDIKVPRRNKILALEKAGNWITTVHDHFFSSKGVIPYEKIMVNLMKCGDHLKCNATRTMALDTLKKYERLLGDIKIDVTKLHGDFKTDNMIVSGNNLVGIDTRLVHKGASFRDIAYFINQLDILFYQPKGLCQSWFLRSQCHRAFFKGVRDIWAPEQYFALLWMRLASILMIWANLNSTVRNGLRRHYLEFVCKRLTKELSRQLIVSPISHHPEAR